MSINWVMLHDTQGFVRLPGEKPVYHQVRAALAITTPRAHPGNQPLAIHSASGTVYLTNQRILYLPSTPTPELQSFSAPLLNLHDSHVTVPWFGPNSWQAALQPVPGGGLPATHNAVELKFTFKEGGATDFHSNFERIRERLQQALEAAHDSGAPVSRQDGFLGGVNMDSVHLDQLPTYEDSRQDPVAAMLLDREHLQPAREQDIPLVAPIARRAEHNDILSRSNVTTFPPAEAPPGYEETQQRSVQEELERRLGSASPD